MEPLKWCTADGQEHTARVTDNGFGSTVYLMIDGYYVLTIHPDGTFSRPRGVSKRTGLKLDEQQRIVEAE